MSQVIDDRWPAILLRVIGYFRQVLAEFVTANRVYLLDNMKLALWVLL